MVFSEGQAQARISVLVVDDDIPELQELLMLQLTSVRGDAVLVTPTLATLIIDPSDDPNGVFLFSDMSLLTEAEEGDTVQLS